MWNECNDIFWVFSTALWKILPLESKVLKIDLFVTFSGPWPSLVYTYNKLYSCLPPNGLRELELRRTWFDLHTRSCSKDEDHPSGKRLDYLHISCKNRTCTVYFNKHEIKCLNNLKKKNTNLLNAVFSLRFLYFFPSFFFCIITARR